MKKEDYYVEVKTKQQGVYFKEILKAAGENFNPHYQWDANSILLYCKCDDMWYFGGSILSNKRVNTSFGILVNLLMEKEIVKPKIAVKVENEKEFNALMKYYDSLGYVWTNGREKATSIPYSTWHEGSHNSIPFENEFFWVEDFDKDYQIIPFSDFAKEHNIKLPVFQTDDGVDVFEMDNFWWVQKVNGEYLRPVESCLRNHKPDKDLITFSTKESALKWLEEQKPKEIIIDLNHQFSLEARCTKESASIFYRGGLGNPIEFSKENIESIHKAMQELS